MFIHCDCESERRKDLHRNKHCDRNEMKGKRWRRQQLLMWRWQQTSGNIIAAPPAHHPLVRNHPKLNRDATLVLNTAAAPGEAKKRLSRPAVGSSFSIWMELREEGNRIITYTELRKRSVWREIERLGGLTTTTTTTSNDDNVGCSKGDEVHDVDDSTNVTPAPTKAYSITHTACWKRYENVIPQSLSGRIEREGKFAHDAKHRVPIRLLCERRGRWRVSWS